MLQIIGLILIILGLIGVFAAVGPTWLGWLVVVLGLISLGSQLLLNER